MSGLASAGFLAYLAGAVSMGMTCGTGCSPAISIFLSSYVMHAEGDTKKSLLAFFGFFIGKASAVMLVCLIASAAGIALVNTGGYFGKYRLQYLMPGFLILTGAYMLRKCWMEYRHRGCAACGGHCHSAPKKFQNASPVVGGFLYGLTPCAPLILLTGYAITLPVFYALVLGAVFSCACMISPLLLMLVMVKLIAVKMRSEAPSLFLAAKCILSLCVMVVGIVTCFTGIEAQL